jgi:cation:H+ antiporter
VSLGGVVVALVAGGVAVALAAQTFTNAIEWLGYSLKLGDRLLGGVLAAWGTALPELAVPLVAVLGGSSAAHDVGIGAILGAPFLLATMAFALIGGAVGLRAVRGRSRTLGIDPTSTSGDLLWFAALLAVAVAVGTPLLHPYRLWAVPVLLGGYVVYLITALRHGGGEAGGRPERFALWRPRRPPPLWAVLAEATAAIALLLAGAEAFVSAVTGLGHNLGVSHLVLAVVLAPLATELPEVLNSVVWTWRGRDDLALSAVTGAMIIQSTVGPSLGLALTTWRLGPTESFAAGLALVAALFFGFSLRGLRRLDTLRLLFGAAFYAMFLLVTAVG